MLLSKFEEGKVYRFSTEKLKEYLTLNNESFKPNRIWAERCEGQLVDVKGEKDGYCTKHKFMMSPQWCVEVEDDKSRDEG